MAKIRSVSLKFWLPVFLLLAFLVFSALSLWYNYASQSNLLIDKSVSVLREDISSLSAQVSQQGIRIALAKRAVDPRYQTLVAVDASGKVIYSIQSKYIGAQAGKTLEAFDNKVFNNIKHVHKPVFDYDAKTSRIKAYFPLNLQSSQSGIRIHSSGALFAVYDLSVDFKNLLTESVHKSLVFSAVLLVLMCLLMLFTYFFISRPISHMIDVSDSLAKKDAGLRVSFVGGGEFAKLGERFNHMADSLRRRLYKQKLAELDAKNREELLNNVILAIEDIFLILDLDGVILDCKVGDPENLYIKPEKFLNKKVVDVLPPDVGSQFQDALERAKKSTHMTRFQYKLPIQGEEKYFEARLSLLNDKSGLITVIRDIHEQVMAEEQMYHQAHFDSLTGMPNRLLSLDRLQQMLLEQGREHKHFAVMFIDLDDFKKINDSLGHEAGDKLLIETSARLQSVMRQQDTIGRLGGDEFIVLMKYDEFDDISSKAETLVELFRHPFRIDNRDLLVSVSVGIAVYPEDGDSVSDLIRKADAAMYHAKASGRNMFCYFTSSMNDAVSRRVTIEEQMHGALERGEFEVFYQPQFLLENLTVIGAEALLRWQNPVLGRVSPEEFIPIAEQNGAIVEIGEFVFEQVSELLMHWQQRGIKGMRVAANLSPRQFRDPNLLPFLEEIFGVGVMGDNFVELEITEGVLMTGLREVQLAITQLHELGIELALDDFGTGYSSLNYLRKYPFDVLKIDKSFIADISSNTEGNNLVNAIINMSHALGLKVVAEGIENEGQLSLLQGLKCDIGQGFFLARPMSVQQFDSWLATQPVPIGTRRRG